MSSLGYIFIGIAVISLLTSIIVFMSVRSLAAKTKLLIYTNPFMPKTFKIRTVAIIHLTTTILTILGFSLYYFSHFE